MDSLCIIKQPEFLLGSVWRNSISYLRPLVEQNAKGEVQVLGRFSFNSSHGTSNVSNYEIKQLTVIFTLSHCWEKKVSMCDILLDSHAIELKAFGKILSKAPFFLIYFFPRFHFVTLLSNYQKKNYFVCLQLEAELDLQTQLSPCLVTIHITEQLHFPPFKIFKIEKLNVSSIACKSSKVAIPLTHGYYQCQLFLSEKWVELLVHKLTVLEKNHIFTKSLQKLINIIKLKIF